MFSGFRRLRWWALALVLLMPAVGRLAAQRSPATSANPAVVFRQGQEALAAGDLDAAEAAFRAVLSLDRRSAAAHANLGVVFMRRKDWEHALAELHKAQHLDPGMAGVRLNIGLVEYKRANYEAAIAPLTTVVHDQPDVMQARYLLGLCYSFLEQHGKAVKALEPLWPKMSDQFVYLYVLSSSAFRSGNKQLDEKATQRLIEVGGDTPQFHLLMAKALLNHSDDQRALEELKKVEAVDPKFPFLHFNLGLAYEHLQDHENAEAEYRKDIELEPDLAYSHEQLARMYLRDDKEQEALEEFRAALARDARQPNSHLEVARILMRKGGAYQKQALEELNAAKEYAPRNHSVRTMRGQLLIRMGRKEEGQAELAEAKKLFASGLAQEQEKMQEHLVPSPEVNQQP